MIAPEGQPQGDGAPTSVPGLLHDPLCAEKPAEKRNERSATSAALRPSKSEAR